MRRLLLVAGALSVIGLPALAQEKGTWEFGGFARYTRYDGSFSTSEKSKNSYGGGGRIGYFLSPKFALELDGSFNATDLDNYFTGQQSSPIRYWPFHLRGIFNAPLGSGAQFLIGGGPVLNYFANSSNPAVKTIHGTDVGLGGLVGFRFKLLNWLSLRADGTLDWMPSPVNAKDKIIALGPVDPTVPGSNTHLGVQLGLSIFPNSKCTKRLDAIDLTPNTANATPGQSVQFSTTGRLCDGSSTSPQVTYSASSGATVGPNGAFSATNPGTYQVIARTLNGKLADTSSVTVSAPPPPPPPPAAPPRITSCSISPKTSDVTINESVTFTVNCAWSDGNNRAMRSDECALSADGNPTASGATYTWTRSGTYTVSATCGGISDRATVTVRPKMAPVTLRALFGTNKYSSASQIDRGTLDSVAAQLKADPSIHIYVDGHTDWRNSTRYNTWLGQKRADYILGQLARRGVDRSRMHARSFGECKPAADNSSDDGMQQNRRVEVSQMETSAPEAADTSCADSGPRGASKIGRPGGE
jgi:outer membrane protein OmpA-like peptidoglycan-associated protein